MAAKDELGRRGEDLAVEYLSERGIVVLSRNWRCRDGELDVVAVDNGRLVVCEVKTRSGTGYGGPAEAITKLKAARIRKLAHAWLATYSVAWCEIRFDVIAILAPPGAQPTLQHYESAF